MRYKNFILCVNTRRCLSSCSTLDKFISLVPVGTVPKWDWFFEEERGKLIDRIDGEICYYPEGIMSNLYIAYISNPQNAKQLFQNLG